MYVKVVALRYQEAQQGFPPVSSELKQVCSFVPTGLSAVAGTAKAEGRAERTHGGRREE